MVPVLYTKPTAPVNYTAKHEFTFNLDHRPDSTNHGLNRFGQRSSDMVELY